MPKYQYEATQHSGDIIKGEINAVNQDEAIHNLQMKGYFPFYIGIKRAFKLSMRYSRPAANIEKLGTKELPQIIRELAIMLQAGLPIENALNLLARSSENLSSRSFLSEVLKEIRVGSSFADALQNPRFSIPKTVVSMVRAGEYGGGVMLETTMHQLSEHLAKAQIFKENIYSILLYPAILLIIGLLSIAIMFTVVLPEFEPAFQAAGNDLATSAKIIISISHLCRDYGGAIIAFFVALAVVSRRLWKQDSFRLKFDHILLKIKPTATIITKIELTRLCTTLGALLSHGVPIASALPLAAEGVNNRIIYQAIMRVADNVRTGGQLSVSLHQENLFPPLFIHTVRIGEETGKLDMLISKAADIFSLEVQRKLTRILTLSTPIITLILGLIFGILTAAMLSAILSVNDSIL